ncbi:DNA primase [Aquabacterium fontiphilum]|uniref:DNA primase n=1 Tax=Aquabacterium fontiphilum TaxID=450365 RepID=UPI0013771849|nr:DNA primase [Aquabacterium fontiphilum]
MIPPSFIQDLLARTDVADLVGRYVTLKKAGINYKGLCPFHGEKSPSFIVSPSRQTYHCFGCGAHGNAIGFLMEYSGLSFVEAVKDLAQQQGMQVPDDRVDPQERERQRQQKEKQRTLTEVMAQAARHWKKQLKATPRAVTYLKGRGLTGDIAARFGLGYAPDSWHGLASAFAQYDDPLLVEAGLVIVQDAQPGESEGRRYDRFRDRIMFPIRNPQGEVIGFGGRVLDKGEPKYLNSPETPVFVKGRELYGLFEGRAALRNKGYAIVTEGYMDVVALAQWGFGNAVATLGTACTAEHVQKLFRFTEQVVFCFDGDAAGRRAAGRALEAALPFATDTRRISFLFLPPEHDPDSYIRAHGAEAFEACVQKAVPLSRQVLEHARDDCDLDTAEGRARLLVQAIPLLAQFPEGALQGLIADELAQMARTPPEEVRRRLTEHLARREGAADRPRRGDAQGASDDGVPAYASNHGPPDDAEWAPDAPPDYSGGASQARRSGAYGDRRPWRGGKNGWRGSRWDARGAPLAPRPLPRAASSLDRIVWVLVSHSEFWEQLAAPVHDLLCDQPAPYGYFFRWLDRLVHDQGPLVRDALLAAMTEEQDGDELHGTTVGDLAALAGRIKGLLDMPDDKDTVDSLVGLIRPLELVALQEEFELLTQSGELSEAAEARKLELIRLSTAIKLEISQSRPISR